VVVRVASVEETEKSVTMRFDVTDTGSASSGGAVAHLRRVHAGRRLDHAQARRLGPRARDQQAAGGDDGRDDPRRVLAGAGSTFWFTSSFEKQATQSQPARARSDRPAHRRARADRRIERRQQRHPAVAHEQLGNEHPAAATPKQATELLAKAAARGVPYDIALVDLAKPGLDALEFARGIRRRAEFANLRLVMLTRRHADIRSAREAGFDACLVKPVRQTVLYEAW
jgi:CheY-like chemotaxis protein